jgi:GNAT superfamily N-acetyltransferase
MPSDLRIRDAIAADAGRLTELARSAKATWRYPAEWLELWRVDLTLTSDYIRAHRAFVAEADATIVGVAVLEDRADHWALEHVWIDPTAQGKNVGRKLVGHALAVARALRPSLVTVLSDPFAEGFYARLGARRVEWVPAPMPGAPDRRLPLLEFPPR